ncbi:unnamed protein product, partial [Effrenium voratum]
EALAGHDPKLAHEGPKPKAAQEAVGKEPSLKERADAQARAGEYAAALRMYEELLEQGGADRLAVLCNAALMALKVAPEQCRWASVKQMLQLALKYSDEALRLNPNNVKAHFRRGCALEALERFRLAAVILALGAPARLLRGYFPAAKAKGSARCQTTNLGAHETGCQLRLRRQLLCCVQMGEMPSSGQGCLLCLQGCAGTRPRGPESPRSI